MHLRSAVVKLIALAALQLSAGQSAESASLIQRAGRGVVKKAIAAEAWGTNASGREDSRVLFEASAALAAEDIVGYWRFDDPTGSRHWRDDSLSGNSLVSVRTTSSHHGQFAEIMPGAGLGGSGAVRYWDRSCAIAENVPFFRTVSFWMKKDAGCCWRISGLMKATLGGKSWLNIWAVHGHFYAKAKASNGKDGDARVKAWAKKYTGQDWEHYAVTSEAGGRVKIYVNGKLKGNGQQRQIAEPPSGSTVTLKVGTGGPHNQLQGVLDELRLYRSTLTASEVKALATSAGTSGVPPGENLPPRPDAGPVVTMWKPQASALLEGTCVDQDSSEATASWQVVSGPDPAAVTIPNPSLATTELAMAASAPTGDYVLELTCSDGTFTRSAKLTLVVFEAHEAKVGDTIETLGPSGPFAGAGAAVKPAALWLFDGDLSSAAPGGEDAKIAERGPKPGGEYSFVADGRFGGALQLNCGFPQCAQLDLGNPEGAPWPSMSVSLWLKWSKVWKTMVTVKKGAFELDPKLFRGFEQGDAWHHIVLAQDGEIHKFYLDGELVEAIRNGVADRTAADAADGLTFGITGGSASSGFSGLVDELAVFDFILSNEEVEVLYSKGAQSFTARGTMNPYSRISYNPTMLSKYFPELTEEPDYTGFKGFKGGATPSSDSPPAYVHPRIFFTPDELPAFRKRYLYETAGRTMMDNMRSLLEWNWKKLMPFWKEGRNFTETEIYGKEVAQGYHPDIWLIMESFRTLIDGDSTMAVRIGQQLDALADMMQAKLDGLLEEYKAKKSKSGWKMTGLGYDDSNFWFGPGQQALRRGTTVAFIYDFVYPWLQPGTRDKVRKLIATATQKVWALGMDAVQAWPATSSNWQVWVEGDLVETLLAIEGEDGFDKGVYARAAKAMKSYTRLGISALSGASYEGMGKNSIVGGKLLALAKHGYPEIIVGSGIRKFGTKFMLHCMLPNGRFFTEDEWGSVETGPRRGDIAPLKYAFPDDKVVDWVWRNAVEGTAYAGIHMDFGGGDGALPYRNLAMDRETTYKYDCMGDLVYVTDWAGPEDRQEHAKLATAGEPLTWVAKDTGLMVTRSAWADEGAAWLAFNVRTLPGGHVSHARGEFIFHAIGQTWAYYATGKNADSWMHSVILVDGKGQGNDQGVFVQVQDSPEGTFGSMDAREAYGIGHFGGTFMKNTVNSYMIEPLPYAFGELPYSKLPNWYNGAGPNLPESFQSTPAEEKAPQLFVTAYRTVGLVRAANPYALVLDDIQKDDKKHVYAWRMPLRDKYYKFNPAQGTHGLQTVNHGYFKPDGNDFILQSTEKGDPSRLLVRLLDGSSPHTGAKIAVKNQKQDGQGTIVKRSFLQVTAKGVSARFRMLLWPLKDPSSPLPATSWDEASSTLTIDGDEITLPVTSDGATMVQSLTVAGASASFETQTRDVTVTE